MRVGDWVKVDEKYTPYKGRLGQVAEIRQDSYVIIHFKRKSGSLFSVSIHEMWLQVQKEKTA